MGETKIQWTSGPNGEEGYTFNPWLGCAKAHTGCRNCYAEKAQPVVMRKGGAVQWGEVWQGGQRVVVADSTWKKPLQWAREAANAGQRRKLFCASLADVLEAPAIPKAWPVSWTEAQRDLARGNVIITAKMLDTARARLWDVIRQTAVVMPPDGTPREVVDPDKALRSWPGLDWLILTKRPENWHLVTEYVRPLVWLGTSISDQKTADEWVPRLLESKGFRLRFLSVEPLVGPVNLRLIRRDGRTSSASPPWWILRDALTGEVGTENHNGLKVWHAPVDGRRQRVDWVIVGGESGPDARPCNIEWVRDLVRQCREAKVPCFVKQLGSVWAKQNDARLADGRRDTHGANMDNWPEDLRVREFPKLAA